MFFRPRYVFVLDYLSFIQDREILGIFDSLDKAIDALKNLTAHKLWHTGDIYSIYKQNLNEIEYEGLCDPVLYVNIYGPSFYDSKIEKVYLKIIKEHIPKTTTL
jgi:hypothetical protein